MTTADGTYRPAQGLKAYFSGTWSFLRRLDDRRLRAQGSILGFGRFRPGDEGLTYDERGRLVFAGGATTATQRYRYRCSNDGRGQVFFGDGRPCHGWDLTGGEDRFRHRCTPDLYEGRCRLLNDNAWQLEWRVTGPRKDLHLATVYLRFADHRGCFDTSPIAGL